MARHTATKGQWNLITDTGGQMLLEARYRGVHVDTSGLNPADPTEGYSLADGMSMVIASGVPVSVWPITDADTDVFAHLI